MTASNSQSRCLRPRLPRALAARTARWHQYKRPRLHPRARAPRRARAARWHRRERPRHRHFQVLAAYWRHLRNSWPCHRVLASHWYHDSSRRIHLSAQVLALGAQVLALSVQVLALSAQVLAQRRQVLAQCRIHLNVQVLVHIWHHSCDPSQIGLQLQARSHTRLRRA